MVVVIVISDILLQRVTGHHIALIHIIRLKGALRATLTSSEYKELKVFEQIEHSLLQEEFWKPKSTKI